MPGKTIAKSYTLSVHFLTESALMVLMIHMLQERRQIHFTTFKTCYNKSLANDLDNETFATLTTFKI